MVYFSIIIVVYFSITIYIKLEQEITHIGSKKYINR
jgi:hypothetical protein